jgi:hypothetical protein
VRRSHDVRRGRVSCGPFMCMPVAISQVSVCGRYRIAVAVAHATLPGCAAAVELRFSLNQTAVSGHSTALMRGHYLHGTRTGVIGTSAILARDSSLPADIVRCRSITPRAGSGARRQRACELGAGMYSHVWLSCQSPAVAVKAGQQRAIASSDGDTAPLAGHYSAQGQADWSSGAGGRDVTVKRAIALPKVR